MQKMPKELIKVTDADFTLTLGFYLHNFTSSYQKVYYVNNYIPVRVTMLYSSDECFLFKSFFEQVLKNGTESFKADFYLGFGEAEYILTAMPTISNVEADWFNVTLELLQKKQDVGNDLRELDDALFKIINTLKYVNQQLDMNILADQDTKDICLSLLNINALVTSKDINKYNEVKILTNEVLKI